MVSSTVGSPIWIGWKRRSRAASFSTCLRYSSSVVAPMVCSSPRASIGFSMFDASIAPSAAPAPTTVWSSSMNRTIWPSEAVISLSTALRRSSNSPRYFAPASSAPRSSAKMRLLFRPSGTSPRTMRCARPSTIAVFPTPGSPMSTGLFLVRRESTWMTRRISSSRPITGSSLFRRARSVRSRPYFSSAWNFPSGFGSVTRWFPRISRRASRARSRVMPSRLRCCPTDPVSSTIARKRCSVETYSSVSASISRCAWFRTRRRRADAPTCTFPPLTRGRRARSASTAACSCCGFPPRARIRLPVVPPSWARSAEARCSTSISAWPRSVARVRAATIASWDFSVSLLGSIRGGGS